MEEIVRAFNWLIRKGLARFWGTSEWTPAKFEEACQVAERLGLQPPIVEQCQYNMMYRQSFERDFVDIFERREIGTTIWSPLCGGFLTGKYNDGKVPEGSRGELMYKKGGHLSRRADMFFSDENKEKTVKTFAGLAALAKEVGVTQAQLALAWSLAAWQTSTAILGFSRTSQIDENLDSIALLQKWSPDLEQRANAILGNNPSCDLDQPESKYTVRKLQI